MNLKISKMERKSFEFEYWANDELGIKHYGTIFTNSIKIAKVKEAIKKRDNIVLEDCPCYLINKLESLEEKIDKIIDLNNKIKNLKKTNKNKEELSNYRTQLNLLVL
jgi:hypothetical protein